MFHPVYIAKRVNDEYVLVRVDPEGRLQRCITAGLGLGLINLALRRRGTFSALGLLAGAAMAYQGVTGRRVSELLEKLKGSVQPAGRSPSYKNRKGFHSRQVPADAVEEAQMESFPASDPPASQHSV